MLSYRLTLAAKAVLLGAVFAGVGSGNALARDNTFVSVSVTSPDAPPAITVNIQRTGHWSVPQTPAVIYRTESLDGTSNWGSPIATVPWTAGINTFVDTNVEVGKRYLYHVVTDGRTNVSGTPQNVKNYVTGGIATSLVEDRGIMLLVTDSVTAPQLVPEITRFKQDLIGDGYRVQTITVSPTDTPQSVKAQITAAYNANPSLVKSVTLLGNIPVAKSGSLNPDGHGNRPFPTDTYYADINGTWTFNESAGRFNQNTTPSPVDLQVGRISFNNMPAFTESEVELMRRYLDKNHAYRHGGFEFNANVMSPQTDSLTGYGASGALFGTPNRPFVPDINAERAPSWWSESENNAYWLSTWYRGGGQYDYTYGIGSSTDLADSPGINQLIQSAWASYYGEWDRPDAFLRAFLAAKGQTLVSFYELNPGVLLYQLGAGDTVGNAWKTSVNKNGVSLTNSTSRSVILSLLGDPSIRLFPVAPPSNVVAEKNGGVVTLSWDASPDEDVLGYYLYRADSLDGEFVRISPDLIPGLTFTDFAPVTESLYMLRAITLQETGSGTYYDASQGMFAIPVTVPEPASVLVIGTAGLLLLRRSRKSRQAISLH